jgi:selenophosphate synthetase-related protein
MALPRELLNKIELAIDMISTGAHPVDIVDAIQDGIQDKRRQMASGLKVTLKAFGRGRRIPIAAAF